VQRLLGIVRERARIERYGQVFLLRVVSRFAERLNAVATAEVAISSAPPIAFARAVRVDRVVEARVSAATTASARYFVAQMFSRRRAR